MDPPMDEELPLVVDLDGTLIKSNMLLETLVAALHRKPWLLFALPFWLLRGRAGLKRELAGRVAISPRELPYRDEVVKWLGEERGRGRRMVLATASDEKVARSIADHLGTFDEVVASDGRSNLKGPAKRRALVERYGERGFDYAGDGVADLEVWASARRAIVVTDSPDLFARAGRAATQAHEIRIERKGAGVLWKALRIQQWPKNLLVFVPLVTAHLVNDSGAVAQSVAAFAAFCLAASAIYVANDLIDLQADRLHDSKRLRPFASGDLALGWGLALPPLLFALGFAVAAAVGRGLALAVACYAVAGLAYSSALKRVAIMDVIVIAGLYTLRLVGGAAAIQVELSDWLFAFSMFIFFSLAFAKRHAELAKFPREEALGDAKVPGRGYRPSDLPFVAILGAVSGYLSVMVLALYITSHEVLALYQRPSVLWAMAVLMLYWITRVWLLAHRRELNEDPLSFALHDPVSYAVGALTLLVLYVAT
ncbi:MAG: UbiA family prenyltransferase [Usitatibacter sp.]